MFAGNAEYQLIVAGTSRGGWVGERPELSRDVEDACVQSIAKLLLPEREQEFRRYLPLIFSQMVGAEQLRQSYRLNAARMCTAQDRTSGLGSGRVAKYGTATRRSLEMLRQEYQLLAGHRHVSHTKMVRFFHRLKRDPAVFGALCAASGMEQSRRLQLWFHLPARRAAFVALNQAFSDANVVLQHAARSGPSDPVYEQLARALVGLYLRCTGRSPRRSYRAIEGEDAGRLLRLCQIMAQAINDALPETVRRSSTQKMAKTARRMMDELKAELTAGGARRAG